MSIEELSDGKCWMFSLEIDGKKFDFLCFKHKKNPYIEIDFNGKGYGLEWRASTSNLEDMSEIIEDIKEKIHAFGIIEKEKELKLNENKNIN